MLLLLLDTLEPRLSLMLPRPQDSIRKLETGKNEMSIHYHLLENSRNTFAVLLLKAVEGNGPPLQFAV